MNFMSFSEFKLAAKAACNNPMPILREGGEAAALTAYGLFFKGLLTHNIGDIPLKDYIMPVISVAIGVTVTHLAAAIDQNVRAQRQRIWDSRSNLQAYKL